MADIVHLPAALAVPDEPPATQYEIVSLLEMIQAFGLSDLNDREEGVLIEALYDLLDKRLNEG
jgi:hypothetical protein